MTLAELIAWHRGQSIEQAELAAYAAYRAEDKRASRFTRQTYLSHRAAAEALLTHHNAAVALLESLQ